MTPMNDNPSIVAIVEGPGDKTSVPSLVRRILYERLERYDIVVSQSKVAHTKSKLLVKLEKFLEYALLENCAAILVILDADDQCPLEQTEDLVERATGLSLNVPVAIVYANSEYETWFICSLSQHTGEGIRSHLGISPLVISPNDVESITSAKGWLTRNMPSGRRYKETVHQDPLTHHIDLDLTHSKSRSFRRLCHAIEEIVHAIDHCAPVVTPHLS